MKAVEPDIHAPPESVLTEDAGDQRCPGPLRRAERRRRRGRLPGRHRQRLAARRHQHQPGGFEAERVGKLGRDALHKGTYGSRWF